MLNYQPLISIIEVLLVTVPALLTVAFVTIAERKTMASMQRRLGPNIVGYWGLLQALKKYVRPIHPKFILFFLGPIIILIFSLLGYIVISQDAAPAPFLTVTIASLLASIQISLTSIFIIFSVISFMIFYLDNFKLSSASKIKYFQLFFFVTILIIIITLVYNITNYLDIISYVSDKNNEGLHGEYNMTKEAAENIGKGMNTIGQGLSTVGSQLGLGATMVGVSASVAKGVAKSGIPPVQKAGVIIGGAVAGGFFHAVISAYNRNVIKESTLNSNNTNYLTNDINSNISKFIDDSFSSSPLQTLLFSLQGLSATCLSLIIILVVQIIYKLHLKNNIKLNLTCIFGVKLNNTIEYYINKIITLNKKMSVIYIWLILIIVTCSLSLTIYISYDLYNNNIDRFIAVHNSINPIANLNISKNMDGLSPMRERLFKFCIINYVCLILMIIFSTQIISKLHLKNNIKLNLTYILGIKLNNTIEYYINKMVTFNKETSIIYILLILIIVIFALSFSIYISGDLFNNIDRYIIEHIKYK